MQLVAFRRALACGEAVDDAAQRRENSPHAVRGCPGVQALTLIVANAGEEHQRLLRDDLVSCGLELGKAVD